MLTQDKIISNLRREAEIKSDKLLAVELGVHPVTVSRWRNNKLEMDFGKVMRFALSNGYNLNNIFIGRELAGKELNELIETLNRFIDVLKGSPKEKKP